MFISLQSGGREMERIHLILLPVKAMREIHGNILYSSEERQHLGPMYFFPLIPVYGSSVLSAVPPTLISLL